MSSRSDDSHAGAEGPPRVSGGVEDLGRRARKAVLGALEEGERPAFCLLAPAGQAIVVCDRRLLVVKSGRRSASLLGVVLFPIPYEAVAAVTVDVGPVNSVISVTSLRGGPARQWWHSWTAFDDPLKAASSLVVPTGELALYEPWVERVRRLVAGAQNASWTPSPSLGDAAAVAADDLVSSLERLAALRNAGAISEDEFERAKAALLR
jgi:hypothetical protein